MNIIKTIVLNFIKKIIGLFLFYKLPKGFKRSNYLTLNPDLKKSGVDATYHYLKHGRSEGRAYKLDLTPLGNYLFDDKKDFVLLVGHEASLTGAPMLTLNLATKLRKKYNVVILLLGSGKLMNNFLVSRCAIISLFQEFQAQFDLDSAIGELCAKYKFRYSIVNSVEARPVLKELKKQGVKTLSLIHEFMSCYSKPQSILEEVLDYSSKIIFSAKLTLNDAIKQYPKITRIQPLVMPQGKSVLLDTESDEDLLNSERERILDELRFDEDSFLVIGVGSVQYRKGVDLFIDVAKNIKDIDGGRRVKFVWVGSGFDPSKDPHYSVYLEDQIHRSGLDDYVKIVRDTFLISEVYERADLLLLTSRLDPLPNVVIDAFSEKLPVICFDGASGISDFLRENQLDKYCVADYLNTRDMAKKTVEMLSSKKLSDEVANKSHLASSNYFDMDRYVRNLDALGSES